MIKKFNQFFTENTNESVELINEWVGTIGSIGNVYLKLDDRGGLRFIRGIDNEILHLDKNQIDKLYKILKSVV